jgi:hypothetical protein
MTNALYIRLGRSRLTVVTVSNRLAGHCQKKDQQRDWRWAMSQNMPLLNRVLGTAALASVIVVLLMSYQWGRAP